MDSKKIKSINYKLVIWLMAISASLVVIACNPKTDTSSSNDTPPPVPVVPPAGPKFTNSKASFFAQNTKMDRYWSNSGSSMTLTNGYLNVLKYAMRTCDRTENTGGNASCSAFMGGLNDIMVFADSPQGTTGKLVIRSMYDTACQSVYYCSQYWYSIPTFKQFILGMFGFNTFNNSNIYNPMSISVTIWPVNNNKGFEMRGNAPGMDLYYNSGGLLFQFIVENGKLEDSAWDYKLVFNGAVAATGRMIRCSTSNCGVSGL